MPNQISYMIFSKLNVVRNLILFAYLLCLSQYANAQVSFTSDELKISLNKQGSLTELSNSASGKNYLSADTLSGLITLVSKSTRFQPSSMSYDKTQKKMTLGYKEAGVTIDVRVENKNTHLVLEIIRAVPAIKIDAIIWGPIPNTISKTIGEIIGVVRDGEISLGIQALNIKTLGGDYPSLEGSTWARGIAAVPAKWGSKLQAYSINRDRDRFVDAWGGLYKNMPVKALRGETVVGSKIAVFSCKEAQTFDRLEQIEIAENLPRPKVNGVWFKKSNLYGKSYMISSYGEKDIDEMIGYTKRAGLVSLYHEGPFKSWGKFVLNPEQFPNGKDGLKNCVDKAHAAGLFLGMHTLTNFINTNDPYISPVPDNRLSFTGTSTLNGNVDADQNTIEVISPEYFNDEKGNNMHTVKIGSELIRYKSVSSIAPYLLLDCQRGAFGTTRSAHQAGDQVGKLLDHSYNVFFPNLDMQREIATNIANLMNETGVDHLDLDGHEGALASGQGDYALELFAKDIYDQVKHDFIIGTSLSKTFYWHIGSYYNWGEPWYGGFKESMQRYRIDNQGLFDRNFMPHMLGWYLLAENTTLSEMEWMLSRAAGYNAGFAMVARPVALRKNSQTNQLLDAIREWESARNGNAFSKEQQEQLKNPKNEFHLEKRAEGKWTLHQYAMSPVFTREKFERQPGEPTHTTWNLQYQWKEQPLQFRIQITGEKGSVNNIKMQIDNYMELLFPVELAAGESLVSDGTETIRFYDKNGKPKGSFKLQNKLPTVSAGAHKILIDSDFIGEENPKIEVQFKGLSNSEDIQIN